MGVDPWGFDEERQALARRLRDRRMALGLVRAAAFLAFALILLAGGAVALRAWAATLLPAPWAHVALFVLVLFAAAALLGLPFAYVGGLRWEREAGLTARTVRSWLRDQGVAAALGLGASLLSAEVLVWLLDRLPAWWWLVAWGLGLVASFLLRVLSPVLLLPLFYRSRPVSDPHVRSRLEALAARAGVRVVGAFEIGASAKTRRSNAGVTGFGRTRRIVVTDTLLREYSLREVDAVLAHELAHQRSMDPWRGFGVAAGISLLLAWSVAVLYGATHASFGLTSLADPAGLVLLAFYGGLLGAVVAPIELRWSRGRESHADRLALQITRDPEGFASAMVKLHDKNLGVAQPRRWEVWLFYSHPPGRARIELARSFPST